MELGLSRAGAGAAREPSELLARKVLATLLGHALHAVALDALQHVGGIPAFEGDDAPRVHFPHTRADLVEEPAVVRHHEQGAGTARPTARQMGGEPGYGPHVKMIRRLVQKQGVVVAHEQPRQIDAAALSA